MNFGFWNNHVQHPTTLKRCTVYWKVTFMKFWATLIMILWQHSNPNSHSCYSVLPDFLFREIHSFGLYRVSKFWTKIDRELIFFGKVCLFYVLYIFAFEMKTKKQIFWAPDHRKWNCGKSAKMGENLKFGPTENGRLTKEDGLKSKNARKQTHFKIQFYNGKKVTSFKIFTLKFSLSPNV